MARPSDYSPEITDKICSRISEGESLRSICDDEDMPVRSTVRLWLLEHSEFSVQYARAREEQADFYADEIIEISDRNKDDPARSRLQIDARKWKASKMAPRTYGDRLDLNHTNSIETMNEEEIDARLEELLNEAGVELTKVRHGAVQ